jgi:hypothetical protein
MRILSDRVQPDGGQVTFMPGTKFSLLPRMCLQQIAGSVVKSWRPDCASDRRP